MKVHGDYEANGYAHLEGLIPPEVARAFLNRIKLDMERARLPIGGFAQSSILIDQHCVEISSRNYRPMVPFLWGMTPIVSQVTGKELLPTFCYLRVYQQGDKCRVHSDRFACEHSLSMTLAYSDDKPWPLEVAHDTVDRFHAVREDFDGGAHGSVAMQPGDAVLYQGIHHRHGRITPNPNAWSAHLFLHWVDRNGPYAPYAFDQEDVAPDRVELQLHPAAAAGA
jgi:hypothetical protein